jgi:hypothetical protein
VNVEFHSFALGRSGLSIGLKVQAPSRARSHDVAYWASKAGLDKGQLVGLVWNEKVHVGTVTSSKEAFTQRLG